MRRYTAPLAALGLEHGGPPAGEQVREQRIAQLFPEVRRAAAAGDLAADRGAPGTVARLPGVDRRRSRAVVADAAAQGHHLLVLEQDDSLIQHDRRTLYAAVHAIGCQGELRYEHRRAEHELLLAIPDAIAWCWAKGGHWRDRVHPIIQNVRSV